MLMNDTGRKASLEGIAEERQRRVRLGGGKQVVYDLTLSEQN